MADRLYIPNTVPDPTAADTTKLATLRRMMADAERRASKGRTYRSVSLDTCAPGSHGMEEGRWCCGLSEIDAVLPQGTLNSSAVHEMSGQTHGDAAAATGFALALIKQFAVSSIPSVTAPILWCQTGKGRHEFGRIHGAGLKAFGLDSQNILFAEASRNRDLLWALEEGARSTSLLAVVGEVDTVSFTATRRLTLAAAAGGTPVLLLRPHGDRVASAAETRWQVAAAPSQPDPFAPHAPGHPRWRVELSRCRGGRPGAWTVEWNHETYRFRLAEKFSPRLPRVASASFQPKQQERAAA